MPGLLTKPYKRATAKYRYDRISARSPATSARIQTGSNRVIVINQGSKGWTVATTAVAMVLIALATMVGGGMTTWHYWNVELRAAQAERDTLSQRHLTWWKAELQRTETARQQQRELTDGRAKATGDAFLDE